MWENMRGYVINQKGPAKPVFWGLCGQLYVSKSRDLENFDKQ